MAITPKWATLLLAHLIERSLVLVLTTVTTGGGRRPSALEPYWHGGNHR